MEPYPPPHRVRFSLLVIRLRSHIGVRTIRLDKHSGPDLCGYKESSVAYGTASLLVLLTLGPHTSQQPSTAPQPSPAAPRSTTADASIASGISDTAAEFQRRTKRFHSKWPYPAGQFNSVLAGTRQQLLDNLPPDAAPLRAYVMQNFPASIPNVSSFKFIDMKTCGPYINSANDLFSALKSINAYRLDLIVDSTPAGALFELKPVAGDKLTRASRSTLTNVWRGVYNYTVVKDGAKTISGTIDLVREKGNALQCTFVPQSSPGPALPCNLITEQH